MIKDLLGVRADLQLYCESSLEMRHGMLAVLEAAPRQAWGAAFTVAFAPRGEDERLGPGLSAAGSGAPPALGSRRGAGPLWPGARSLCPGAAGGSGAAAALGAPGRAMAPHRRWRRPGASDRGRAGKGGTGEREREGGGSRPAASSL